MIAVFEKEDINGNIHKGLLVTLGKKSCEIYREKIVEPEKYVFNHKYSFMTENKTYCFLLCKFNKGFKMLYKEKVRKFFYDKEKKIIALSRYCILYTSK